MNCVLLLEDDDDLREVLEQALLMSGVEAVHSFRRVEDLIAHESDVLACRSAILDVNLGAGVPTGLDAHEWLRQAGYLGRIIFMTGHAGAYPQVRAFSEAADTYLLEKPAPIPALITLVLEARQ